MNIQCALQLNTESRNACSNSRDGGENQSELRDTPTSKKIFVLNLRQDSFVSIQIGTRPGTTSEESVLDILAPTPLFPG
jgi:hypothetical protein